MKGSVKFLIIALVFAAFAALANMANPLIIRITIDNVLNNETLQPSGLVMWLVNLLGGIDAFRDNIWLAGIAHLIVTTVIVTTVFCRQRFVALGGEGIAKRLKDKLYDHLQKMPYNYHVKAQTGDLIQRCTSDVETIRRFISQQSVEVARAVFFVGFGISIMFTINVSMTFVSMAFLPIIFLFSYVFFRYVRRAFKLADEKEGELSTMIQESLSGIRVVRAFGRGRFEMNKFDKENSEFRRLGFKQMVYLSYYWSASDILCFLQIALVFTYGVYLTYTGDLTTGELILFNSYTAMYVWPVRQLGRVLSDMGRMQVAIGRVYEILDAPEETDTLGAAPHDLRGDIEFSSVDFEYEKGRKIFDGISFKVKKGETIAILGATGSGKSTLMHILLRLYDYSPGSIRINGKELNMISKKHLREKVGIVLQEPFLYSKTIMNNLLMAKDKVEEKEVFEATQTASAHTFIEEFEKGYETIVGEKGVTLSGGQKQRVAIARTLIKNSEMLIFDDSLSAVDTETDAQIRAALAERAGDVTTFIISQRITTLMNADRIFVIENGKLTDSGNHDELVERGGLYSRIWNIQTALELEFEEGEGEAV
ncbi:MAG: ABC transporter ATP-binding protein/permease [Defluviitaleaceae bacterium]|nr:ABC transporter ATP-binding protein/permease [Defluviitaleaceae bacterium]